MTDTPFEFELDLAYTARSNASTIYPENIQLLPETDRAGQQSLGRHLGYFAELPNLMLARLEDAAGLPRAVSDASRRAGRTAGAATFAFGFDNAESGHLHDDNFSHIDRNIRKFINLTLRKTLPEAGSVLWFEVAVFAVGLIDDALQYATQVADVASRDPEVEHQFQNPDGGTEVAVHLLTSASRLGHEMLQLATYIKRN